MLTKQAQDSLQKRVDMGRKCIEATWGRDPDTVEDLETASKDAISDILTAVFGPAGKTVKCSDGLGYVTDLDVEATARAQSLLDAALLAYFGDAEDYDEEEEEPAVEEPKLPGFLILGAFYFDEASPLEDA